MAEKKLSPVEERHQQAFGEQSADVAKLGSSAVEQRYFQVLAKQAQEKNLARANAEHENEKWQTRQKQYENSIAGYDGDGNPYFKRSISHDKDGNRIVTTVTPDLPVLDNRAGSEAGDAFYKNLLNETAPAPAQPVAEEKGPSLWQRILDSGIAIPTLTGDYTTTAQTSAASTPAPETPAEPIQSTKPLTVAGKIAARNIQSRVDEIQQQISDLQGKYHYAPSAEKAAASKQIMALIAERDELKYQLANEYGIAQSADAGELVYGALLKGTDQTAAMFTSTLNFLLGEPAQIIQDLAEQTVNDVLSIWGKEVDFGDNLITRWNNRTHEAQENNEKFFYANANLSRAAQIVDEYGTATVAAIPMAVETVLFGLFALPEMAGQAGTAALTYASTLANSGKLGQFAAMAKQGLQILARDPNYWTSYLQVVGDSYDSAIEKGMDSDTATVYALTNSAVNAAIEIGGADEASGGIQSYLSKHNMGEGTLGGKIFAWIKSAWEEGGEEVKQGIVERMFMLFMSGKEINADDILSFENPEAVFNPEVIGKEWMGGAVVGGVLGAPNLVIDLASGNSVQHPTAHGETLGMENENTAAAQTEAAAEISDAVDSVANDLEKEIDSSAATPEEAEKQKAAMHTAAEEVKTQMQAEAAAEQTPYQAALDEAQNNQLAAPENSAPAELELGSTFENTEASQVNPAVTETTPAGTELRTGEIASDRTETAENPIPDRGRGRGADEYTERPRQGVVRSTEDARAHQQLRRASARQDIVTREKVSYVSTASLGITTGTASEIVRVYDRSLWDEELTNTASHITELTGKEVVYVVGRLQVKTADGEERLVNGVITPDKIIIQCDDMRYSAEQLGDHETLHSLIEDNPGLLEKIINAVKTAHAETYKRLANIYTGKLRGVYEEPASTQDTDAKAEEATAIIVEEIFADAYGGMNKYNAGATELTETVRGVVENEAGQANSAAAETTPTEEEPAAAELPALPEETPAETVTTQEQEPAAMSLPEPETPEIKTTVSENGYTIRDNPEYGSIEISFDGKPNAEVRAVLKENKFRWNKKKSVWYGRAGHEEIMQKLDAAYVKAENAEPENVSLQAAEETAPKAEEKKPKPFFGDSIINQNAVEEIAEDIANGKENPAADIIEQMPTAEAETKTQNRQQVPEFTFKELAEEIRKRTVVDIGNGTQIVTRLLVGTGKHEGIIRNNDDILYTSRLYSDRNELRKDIINKAQSLGLLNIIENETAPSEGNTEPQNISLPETETETAEEPTAETAEPTAEPEEMKPVELPSIKEENENERPKRQRARHRSDGGGTSRSLEEEPAQALQGTGEERGALADTGERRAEDGRGDNRDDAERNERGSGEGSSESGDLRDGVSEEPKTLREETEQAVQQKSNEQPKGTNYVIGDKLEVPTTPKTRYKANVEAIRLIKQLQAEGRYATAEEQKILAQYTGWGGVTDAFDSNKSDWAKEYSELKELLTEDEYRAANASILNAYYTSTDVIKGMYAGLEKLGFKGGRMMEPSSGTGNFVGAMPTSMSGKTRWTMVELDEISGQIAKYLYPQADVRIQGFEKANIPNNYIDVAIGNVPFGDIAVVDRAYPKSVTSAIHNYFVAKTLDKVRPGGIVMFITSHYTMDSRDAGVRNYIADRADLLGAIRLPNTAFKGTGTPVTSDILILQKRAPNTIYNGAEFANGEGYFKTNSGYVPVNEYFRAHPEMVLGEFAYTNGRWGREVTVNPRADAGSLQEQIAKAFENISGKMEYTTSTPEQANIKAQRADGKAVKDGALTEHNGKIYETRNGELHEVKLAEKEAKRVKGLLNIRDIANTLLNAQVQGNTALAAEQREKLNEAYDKFVAEHGAINAPANKRALKDDPYKFSLFALEKYDPETKKAEKTDVFVKDTVSPNVTEKTADSVADALVISRNRRGGVDVDYMAQLTGRNTEEVSRELIESRLAFKDRNGELVAAEEYLSGNVRAKLRDAEALKEADKDYEYNIEALKQVVPKDVDYSEIYVAPGAPWVPDSVYSDFAAHILGTSNNYRQSVKVTKNVAGGFTIEYLNKYLKNSVENTQRWGTDGRSFEKIFDAMLNSRSITVTYKDSEGKTHVDTVATAAANEKVEEITKEFQKWLWEDENRRTDLAYLYNETFNAFATTKYDGSNLTVNGANATKPLRPHQKNAVQRIISSGGNTLLAHRVGAGKTYEMAAAAMKLKELGIVKKPMFIVPKSLVAQWGGEFVDYFPGAKVLVAEQNDFSSANRKIFTNRIANGEYDAVIVSYEQFEKIPVSDEFTKRLYQEQIDEITAAIDSEKRAGNGKGLSVRDMESKKKNLENKIAKLTQKSKDADNIDFEQLGIDSLFVDEAHNFKNLFYTTSMNNVSGLGNKNGSQRAFDLYTKTRYLQQLNGGRGIVFATATPVMNSMSEMYIMQRYLQPDLLKQLGIDSFDAWAKQFGEVVNALEVNPTGTGYRMKQSFSHFKNMSELQQLFRSMADVLTEVPGLKIPKMKGGKVNIVVCEPSEFQLSYMKEIEKRAENVKNVDPSVDNMLKITSDGRKISYTQRMIDPSLPYEEGGKIYRCADNVVETYNKSSDIKGTQLIFLDSATPKGKAKTETEVSAEENYEAESAQLYDDLRARLIKKGIPAKEIAFIHDADTDAKKKKLFADVNEGKVRVLIGSTGKMGVGMNAQRRVVAIHHLDAPWRPGDMEQRNGRAFRQGNINAEVECFTYVTEQTFDSRLWDIIDRKQRFIDDVMNGENVGRDVEDTGEITLSAAEVKALASGSPEIKEAIQLENEIKKLDSLYKAHNSETLRARAKMREAQANAAALEARIRNGAEDVQKAAQYKNFALKIGNSTYTEKADAGLALIEATNGISEDSFTTIGSFAGFEIRAIKTNEGVKGLLYGNQGYPFKVYPGNPTYGITALEKIVLNMGIEYNAAKAQLEYEQHNIEQLEKLANEPFAKEEQLREKRRRYKELMDKLNPPTEQQLESAEAESGEKYSVAEDESEYMAAAEQGDRETTGSAVVEQEVEARDISILADGTPVVRINTRDSLLFNEKNKGKWGSIIADLIRSNLAGKAIIAADGDIIRITDRAAGEVAYGSNVKGMIETAKEAGDYSDVNRKWFTAEHAAAIIALSRYSSWSKNVEDPTDMFKKDGLNKRSVELVINGKRYTATVITALNDDINQSADYGEKFYDIIDIKENQTQMSANYETAAKAVASSYRKIKYADMTSDILTLSQKQRIVNNKARGIAFNSKEDASTIPEWKRELMSFSTSESNDKYSLSEEVDEEPETISLPSVEDEEPERETKSGREIAAEYVENTFPGTASDDEIEARANKMITSILNNAFKKDVNKDNVFDLGHGLAIEETAPQSYVERYNTLNQIANIIGYELTPMYKTARNGAQRWLAGIKPIPNKAVTSAVVAREMLNGVSKEEAEKKWEEAKSKFPDWTPSDDEKIKTKSENGKSTAERMNELLTKQELEELDSLGLKNVENADEYIRASEQRAADAKAARIRTVPKEEFKGTEHTDKLGIKIAGSLGLYDSVDQLRAVGRAAKAIQKAAKEAEKRLRATEAEKEFARGIVRGTYTSDDIPASFDAAKVEELSDYYWAETSVSSDLIRQQRRQIKDAQFEKVNMLLENVTPKKDVSVVSLNLNTPARNLHTMYGDKIGGKLYKELFEPVATNEAERIRFINRQFDELRKFKGIDGQKTALNREERAATQAAVEQKEWFYAFASMQKKPIENINDAIIKAAGDIRNGMTAQQAAKLHDIDAAEKELLSSYKKWLDKIDTAKVENAAKAFSKKYNEMYDAINDVLVSHGYEEIGFIKNYAPHKQPENTQKAFEHVADLLGINSKVSELPTSIAGLTASYKPNKRWDPHFLSRVSDKTNYDITDNFEDYTEYLSDVIYHMDDVMRVRTLSDYLRQTYSPEDIKENISQARFLRDAGLADKIEFLRDHDVIDKASSLSEKEADERLEQYLSAQFSTQEKTTEYSNFVVWLDNYANLLSGKQLGTDRSQEQSWGRRTLNIANKLTKMFGVSQVGAKVSSMLNQTAQMPVITAELGTKYTAAAIKDFVSGKTRRGAWAEESDFLTGKEYINYIVNTPYMKITKGLFWGAEFFDKMMSTIAVRGAYLKAINEGMTHEEAMKKADRFGSEVMGDRSKGTKPLFFESKNVVNRVIGMFQIEALNTWEHVLKDLPRDFREIEADKGRNAAAAALAGVIVRTLLASFLLNRLWDELYGGSPAPFDLFGISANFIASGQGLTTNKYLETIIDNVMEKLGGERVFGTGESEKIKLSDGKFDTGAAIDDTVYNLSNEVPLARNVAALAGWGDNSLPMAGLNGGLENLFEGIKGVVVSGADEKSTKKLRDAIRDLLTEFIPAGGQLKKTWKGLEVVSDGGKRASDGNIQYAVDADIGTVIRAMLFGTAGIPESAEYYASGYEKFSDPQQRMYDIITGTGVSNTDAYDAIREAQDIRARLKEETGSDNFNQDDARAVLDEMDISNEMKAVIWQCFNKTWKGNSNPYDKNIGNQVYAALHDEEGDGIEGLSLPKLD